MKRFEKKILMIMICACIILPTQQIVSAQENKSAKVTKEERLKWWLDARFGMFIHWGAYAQMGGYWKGVYEGGYSEWHRFRQIPAYEYDSLIMAFNPVDLDAEKWVAIARNGGKAAREGWRLHPSSRNAAKKAT